MKKRLALLLLMVAAGCGVTDVSSKMNESNDLMKQNATTVREANQAIRANMKEVNRSTETMHSFNGKIEQIHPYFFPIFIILIIGILCLPIWILMKLTKKIIKFLEKR